MMMKKPYRQKESFRLLIHAAMTVASIEGFSK
jgi:hypothetical protein